MNGDRRGGASPSGGASSAGEQPVDRQPEPARQPESAHHRVALSPTLPLRVLVRRFWPCARPHLPLVAAALAFAVVSSLLAAISIGFFKILVDRVLVPRDLSAFWWVALAYVGLTVVAGGIGYGRRIFGALAGERFTLDLRRVVFDRLQLLSLAFFERQQLGDVLARTTGDVKTIERLMVRGVVSGVSYVLRIIFFAGALFWLQWQLALASLVALPFFGWLARRFSAKIKRATREQTRRSGALSAVVEESLANVPLVQSYNRQDTQAARLDEQAVARFDARMTATRLSAAFAPLIDLVEVAGTLMVAGLGTWMLVRGELSLGGLLAFAAYLSQLYNPVRSLGRLVNSVYAASAAAERVIELLDEEPQVSDRPDALVLPRSRGCVNLDQVSFGYPGTGSEVLHDVTFTAEPGQVVALVGASGAGKSSLLKLLLRFYDADRGAVRVDGHDVREVTTESLREQVAVLLQESPLLDGTIRDNIAYGRPGATEPEILQAARAADVHEFASRLPDGYDTVVGQRGSRLSGGQRQRVAIARAMVRDAPILVLDEPTAALDGAAAQRVLRPLRRLMADRTTVLITHDPAAIATADLIVTLEGGRVTNIQRQRDDQAAQQAAPIPEMV